MTIKTLFFRLITLIFTVTILVILIFIVWKCISPSRDSIREENRVNQDRAKIIIDAIEEFYQDTGHLPENLEDLKLDFLSTFPKTTRETEFEYRISPIDIYLLCFGDSPKANFNQFGCCYNPEFGWDCTPGD